MTENTSYLFERVPETPTDRTVDGRPSRQEVVDFWTERFGVSPEAFDGHTFWEKGSGKLWAYAGDAPEPCDVETLGLAFMRVRQEHWKPTTNAVQRFGRHATRNVIHLDETEARAFIAGETVSREDWDGDWGYLIVTHDLAGEAEPLGVGLYLHGEVRSQVPKGRRRDID